MQSGTQLVLVRPIFFNENLAVSLLYFQALCDCVNNRTIGK